MKKYTTEADARIIIDDLLRQSGWNPADKSQVLTEFSVQEDPANIVSDEFANYSDRAASNRGKSGRADYLLLDQKGRPLAVIEAKRSAFHPYSAKQQTLPYAKKIGAPFIFLTNGELIYFWDYTEDDARIVNSIYSRRDLERLVHMRKNKIALASIKIPEYYIRQGEQRQVRPYQQEAMKALDHALELGKRRFLIELPTGTGKTDLISLYLQRLIEAGRAERVLFLVDREQLAKQAVETLQDIIQHHSSYWLQPGTNRQEKEITVCLLQTMISRYNEFTSGYFDVVIADECHRSIYGAWQTALTHFDAVHIGLTATPAIYIERNTFRFYHCQDQQPDYVYRIQDAFKNKYLVPYKFATGITTIIAEGAEVEDEHYDPAEFERKWTNEQSNRIMMEEFDKLACQNYQELAPGQKGAPGKAIVFAITKHHAARLTQYLNELHPEHKGSYAVVITSDVSNADDLIRKLKYETFPMVAVSVGMLDTGFNCREVLHLVMCRRVRSPILYQQMRGRGTRTAPHINKQKFVIYDFFENHKYFNDSDTDVFTDTSGGYASGRPATRKGPRQELIDLGLEDEWLYHVSYVEVGPEGESIDKRDYVTNWEETIKKSLKDDPLIKKIRQFSLSKDEAEKEKFRLTPEEEEKLAQRLNSPKFFFNEDNLRRAYRQPGGNLIDFIKHALGLAHVKSQDEITNDNFQAWLVTKSFTPQQVNYLNLLKNRGAVKGKVIMDDLFTPPLSILNAAMIGVELFGDRGLKALIEEMNESVFKQEKEVA
ncbi:DEAD/DEAH box helicase family protein [candidate division KSB1 bacterium]|nr:DEAD/DEAH box helicase family protein [candidate division KSB1 bacterium]